MEFVIRVNWRRWMDVPHAKLMFETLPFGMELLMGIMFDCWPAIEAESFAVAHSIICDQFDMYGVEDDFTDTVNPGHAHRIYIEPNYNTIVEIVMDLFEQTKLQLYPVYHNPENMGQWVPGFGGLLHDAAIITFSNAGLAGAELSVPRSSRDYYNTEPEPPPRPHFAQDVFGPFSGIALPSTQHL